MTHCTLQRTGHVAMRKVVFNHPTSLRVPTFGGRLRVAGCVSRRHSAALRKVQGHQWYVEVHVVISQVFFGRLLLTGDRSDHHPGPCQVTGLGAEPIPGRLSDKHMKDIYSLDGGGLGDAWLHAWKEGQ